MERLCVALAWFVLLWALVVAVPVPGWAAYLLGLLAGAVAVWQFGLWAYEQTKADKVRGFPRRTDDGKEA